MIKIILLTLLTGGGYVEEVQNYKGSFEQCAKDAAKHSEYSYCIQTVDRAAPRVHQSGVSTRGQSIQPQRKW